MTTLPAGKTYADIIKEKIQNPRNRQSIRLVARDIDYSYEHVRKVVAGELTFTREFSDSLCKSLGLDAEAMWKLAQNERLKKRFKDADLEVEMPKDTRIKDIWDNLNADQREAWILVGKGWSDVSRAFREGERESSRLAAAAASEDRRK